MTNIDNHTDTHTQTNTQGENIITSLSRVINIHSPSLPCNIQLRAIWLAMRKKLVSIGILLWYPGVPPDDAISYWVCFSFILLKISILPVSFICLRSLMWSLAIFSRKSSYNTDISWHIGNFCNKCNTKLYVLVLHIVWKGFLGDVYQILQSYNILNPTISLIYLKLYNFCPHVKQTQWTKILE